MGDYLDRSKYENFSINNNIIDSIKKDVFSNMAQVFLAINYQLLTNKIAIRGDHEALPIIKSYYLKYLFNENSDNSKGYLAYSLKKILPDSFIIKIKEEKNLIIGNHTTGQDYYKKDEEYNKMMDFIENGENKNGINEDELYKINNFIKDKTGIDNNGLYNDIAEYFKSLEIKDPVDPEKMLNILKKNMGVENIDFQDIGKLENFFNEKMQSYLSVMLYVNENFLKYKRDIFEIKINKDIEIPKSEINDSDDNLIKIYNQNKMPFSLFTRPSNSFSIEEEHIYYKETYGCFQSWNYLKNVIGENFKNFEKILSFSSHNHEHHNSQKYHAIKENKIVISGNSNKINYYGKYKNQFSAIPINDFNEIKKGNVNEKNKSIYQISLPAGTHETIYGEGFKKKFENLLNIGVFMKYNIEDGNLSWVDRNLDPIHKE